MTKMLKPGKTGHTPLNCSCVSPIKMPNFSLTWRWRYSKVYFTVDYLMWQYVYNEARVPQSRIRLGWSVAIRSIHEGVLLCSKLVGSEII